MSGPTGMVFQINPTNGNLIAQPSLATPGAPPNDQPYPGDWQLVVTGCPAGSSAQNIAALVYSNAAIPLPLGIGNRPIRFQVAYSALSAGVTKVTPY